MSVIQPTTFNAAKLSISEAKKLDNGSSQAYINYDSKRLRIQAPRMPIPMDAGDYQGNQKYKVQLSFRDKESNPKVAAYFQMLEKIDEFIINTAHTNCGKWFKKPGMSRELVVDRFTPSIKFAKDKEGNLKPYPPTHAVALKKSPKTGTFDAELYDKEKRLIEGKTPVEVLRRGSEITPILECTGIWITDKGFGATWKLFQARVDTTAEGLEPGCAILDDEDGGEEASVPVVTKAKAAPKLDIVDDEEEADLMAAVKPVVAAEEPEDDEVIEAPPVPKPVTTVKKVVKKVVAKA
jgi:hypothetical protein